MPMAMPVSKSPCGDTLGIAAGRGVYLKLILIGGLLGTLYGWTCYDLVRDWWTQPSLSYGLLLPPLAAYAAWLKKEALFSAPAIPDARGLMAALAGCILHILGKAGAEFFLRRISMIAVFAALVWTFWGRARLRVLAFPLVLLAAMVPLPGIVYNSLAAPLQLLASDIGAEAARLAGITIYRDGNILQLAHISLGVEEACSGLNSLSALMIGSLLFGSLLCYRMGTKIALFVLSVAVAIGINVLRVAGTAVLADYYPELASGFYHMFSGWLVFLAGIAAIYGLGRALVRMFET
jgi:exosortase